MITVNVQQGTPEWYAERCGVPSASSFDKIITTKGEASKQREKYLYQLAGERVSGKPQESYQNGAMQRGIELEAEARSLYELRHDVMVGLVGFCYPDKKRLVGCSPDGIVGADGLLEIKCPEIQTHVAYLLDGTAPTEYFQQLQGQLFVTGRKWVDFMSYYPGLKPLIVRVEPDKAFQAALAKELKTFCADLDAIAEKIR